MIKKIIHTFLHNPMPEQVQQQFRTWCLNKERAGEKTDALWKEWERLDPASVLPADEKAYRRKLDRLHREMTPPAAPKRGLFSITRRTAAAAAAIVLLAMSVESFVVKRLSADTTTWLVTAENSKGRFTLPDGSVVWLNADSRLAYSDRFTASGNRAVRLEGEAFFDVKRDTLRPFEVEMGKLRVKVLGTRFTASHMPAFNTEEVTLLSGKVEVSGYRADQSVVLTPDQSCSYDAGSGAVAVRNVAASNYCSWTGNSIIFDNMTLADIAVNLEHHPLPDRRTHRHLHTHFVHPAARNPRRDAQDHRNADAPSLPPDRQTLRNNTQITKKTDHGTQHMNAGRPPRIFFQRNSRNYQSKLKTQS